MQYLVYRSTALVQARSSACAHIVDVSQRKNARLGLTGFLHVEEGSFLQYLEGPEQPLWDLYEKLHDDCRHTDLVLLGSGRVVRRRFRGWTMGYSAANVLSLGAFLREVTGETLPPGPSQGDAIAFLMAASQRLDLEISEPP